MQLQWHFQACMPAVSAKRRSRILAFSLRRPRAPNSLGLLIKQRRKHRSIKAYPSILSSVHFVTLEESCLASSLSLPRSSSTRDGPSTTRRLYRACLAEDAPAAQSYRQPGHREWRLIGDTIVAGTTPPPNPDHLVRSVRL